MISLDRIGRVFQVGGQPVHALRGVTLTVEPGEFVALVGPSGCGKTTLMRIIAGIETADAGEIVIGNRSVTKLRPADRDV